MERIRTSLLGPEILTTYDEHDLMRVFDSLPPASAHDDMIGHTYKGRVIHCNSVLDVVNKTIVRGLNAMGIEWGKR